MLDHYASIQRTTRTTGLVDGSARPDAPVVAHRPGRQRLEVRTRAVLADRLHRVATALEPRRPATEQSC